MGVHDGCLLLPAGRELRRLVVAPAPRLAELLADMVGLAPREVESHRNALTLSVPGLAQLIAEQGPSGVTTFAQAELPEGARRAVRGLRGHWRVEARLPAEQGGEMVEALDAASGLWLVVPRGRTVELHPTQPAHVWRELTQLVARDSTDPPTSPAR